MCRTEHYHKGLMQAECCILNSHSRVFHNSSPRQTSPYFLGRAWNRIWEIQGPVYMETQRHIKVSQLKYWARQMENLFSSSSEQPCGAQTHFNSLTPEPGVFQWNFLKYSLWKGEVFESGDWGVEKLSPTQWEVPQVSGEADGWF